MTLILPSLTLVPLAQLGRGEVGHLLFGENPAIGSENLVFSVLGESLMILVTHIAGRGHVCGRAYP